MRKAKGTRQKAEGTRNQALSIATVVCLLASAALAQSQPTITVRAARIIDGRGQVTTNQTVIVRGSTIERIATPSGAVTHDLGNLTLLPGFIDTHVHIGW